MRTPRSAEACDGTVRPEMALHHVDAWRVGELCELVVHHLVREEVEIEATGVSVAISGRKVTYSFSSYPITR